MRTKRTKAISFIVLAAMVSLALIATASNSLADITISGTVRNNLGNPLAGISVGLFNNCWQAPVNGAITNASGYYSITHTDGAYLVGVSDNPANPNCGTNYVSEFYNNLGKEPPTCNVATLVNTTQTIDFSLEDGITISGTVTRAAGGAPVEYVSVNLNMGSACDGMYLISAQTDSSGDYCFTVPKDSGDLFYVSADTSHFLPDADVASEWYTSTGGTFYCLEAQGIDSDVDQPGIDFALADGGTISGTLTDNTGAPLQGIMVRVWNDALELGWGAHAWPDANGNFTVGNLAPGPWEIMIQPDPVLTHYVQFNRDYWVNLSEDRNIGTIALQQGALITGSFKDVDVNPVELEYWCGGKFEVGWAWSAYSDGSFQFRLPLGTYALNVDPMDEGGYALPPMEITVTDVNATPNLGNLTVYDEATGATISGTVTDNGLGHNGQFQVIAFSSSQQYTPDKFGGLGPQGGAQPELPGDGSYSLFVPPSQNIDVFLVLYSQNVKALESITVVDSETGIPAPAGGGTSTGHNLAYTSAGYTVDGYVKSNTAPAPPYRASVLLYKQPGDQFAGFADSDEAGYYRFYNVPAGDYKIAVTHRRYPDEIVWSIPFTVSADKTVPDIFMGEGGEKIRADFNGDGKADILLRNTTTGEIRIWLMDGATRTSYGSPGTPDLAWKIEGVADFNADGNSDILLRRTDTGEIRIWLIDGTARTSWGSPGTLGLVWQIEGVADFNADGKSDILLRRTDTGEIRIWLINGTARTSWGSPGAPDLAWKIEGVADFNADGKSDILLRRTDTGEIRIWLINGTARTSYGSPGTPALVWKIEGVADFNADGKSDILLRRTDTGEIRIWLISGTTRTSYGSPGAPDLVWQIEGVADFNADGKSDILLRRTDTGEIRIWLINGTARTSWGSPGTLGLVWKIEGVADFNADGKSDILLRRTDTGEIRIWLINGTARTSWGSPGAPALVWDIQEGFWAPPTTAPM